jgi:hypothetical protein
VFSDGNLLGTPETKRRGLSTRKALSAFMSKPPPFSGRTPITKLMVSMAKVKRLQNEEPMYTVYIEFVLGLP